MVRKTYLCFLLIVLWAATACAAPPQRIVSVSPNLTEILYGLGVFDRVVGVTDYCTYPPEAKSRERVGGWSTPNLERIVRLHPDRLRDTLLIRQGNTAKRHTPRVGL